MQTEFFLRFNFIPMFEVQFVFSGYFNYEINKNKTLDTLLYN